MNKQFLKDAFGWGFLLWLIGYVLGIMLFFFVPPELLGWVITPFGVAITLWVIFKKINSLKLKYYVQLAVVWLLIAIVCDYIFLVKLLHPENGYYKLDVFVYYILIFVLPLIIGWYKGRKKLLK